jgi:O-succinylbenzoate synthase
VELWTTQVVHADPIRAAHGIHDLRRVLYLRVLTDQAEGWGEVGALEQPVGTDPSLEQVHAQLIGRWLPRFLEASESRAAVCPPSQTISLLGEGTAVDRVSAAALEMAVLDAELQLADLSLAAWIGIQATSLPFGAVLGIPEDRSLDSLLASAESACSLGASRIRAKIEPGFAREPLRTLKASLGRFDLHADANGSFDLPAPSEPLDEELCSLDDLELRCLEQPLSTNDLTRYAALSSSLRTPICLDEGLSSLQRASAAIRYGSCGVFCIKPARLGGIRAALSVLASAEAAGVACFLGGLFETGLGRASLAPLAAQPAASLISDLGAPRTYLREDPCGLEGPSGQMQPIWRQPGIGPRPDRAALALLHTWSL